jgi:hypothetical protein
VIHHSTTLYVSVSISFSSKDEFVPSLPEGTHSSRVLPIDGGSIGGKTVESIGLTDDGEHLLEQMLSWNMTPQLWCHVPFVCAYKEH